MTTHRILTSSAKVIDATERDRWPQPSGESVPTGDLTTAHTIAGAGRVLRVARVVIEERA